MYKRQAKSYITKVNNDKEIKEGTKESIYHYIWKDEETGEFVSVSYTHLDVYKRQALTVLPILALILSSSNTPSLVALCSSITSNNN